MPKPERGRGDDDQQTLAGGAAAVRAPGESSSSERSSPSDAPTLFDSSQASPVPPAPPSTPVSRKPAPEDSGGPQLLQPQKILGDRYQILELLGQGGMGAVYKARDLEVNQLVALKVIRPELASNPAIIERFKRELVLARQVTHKNVIRIYDLAEADGVKFITMEYIDGEPLTHVLEKRGKLPAKEAAEMMERVCLALEAAHSEGVVHRDLKPGNIMLDSQGRVLVMDFGLARSVDLPDFESGDKTLDELHAAIQAAAYHSIPGSLVGTPEYMSPEQARREPVDARSDLYAVGLIFYELVTGQRPFASGDAVATLLKRTQENPKPLVEVDPTIPRPLSNIVGKCLQRDREARYQTAQEVQSDLHKWLRPAARKTWVWVSAAAAILVLAVTQFVVQQWLTVKPGAHAPVSLLVSDFKNETGDPVFDGTMEPAFSVAMEGASFITSFNRGQAHKLAAQVQPGAAILDEPLARLVATREGISTVVSGSISGTSDSYQVTVRAIDGVTGKVIATASDHADKKDVLMAMGRLAAKIRKALGDKTPESVQIAAAETFTTRSLEAAHEYAQAQDLLWAGKWEDSIPRYQQAIALDPNLGRAYAGIASAEANLGRRQSSEQYYQQAFTHMDRMTDREKYRTRGGYYTMRHEPQKAIEEYTALLKEYPYDVGGNTNLALNYFYMRDMAKALEVGRHASDSVMGRTNFALYAIYAGEFDTGMQKANEVLESNPVSVAAAGAVAMGEMGKGKIAEAEIAYEKIAKISPRGASVAAAGEADAALYEGRPLDAAHILEKGAAADLSRKDEDSAAIKLTMLGEADLLSGKRQQALADADRALKLSKDTRILFSAGRIYLDAGVLTKAVAVATQLSSRLEPEPQTYGKLLEGEIDLRRDNVKQAINLFTEVQKSGSNWLEHFDLGSAYLAAGLYVEADSEFETCLRQRGEVSAVFLDDIPTFRYLPPVYYYLGRVQQGLNNPAASEAYKTFIAIKEKGGQDPLLADARRRLGSL